MKTHSAHPIWTRKIDSLYTKRTSSSQLSALPSKNNGAGMHEFLNVYFSKKYRRSCSVRLEHSSMLKIHQTEMYITNWPMTSDDSITMLLQLLYAFKMCSYSITKWWQFDSLCVGGEEAIINCWFFICFDSVFLLSMVSFCFFSCVS